MFTLKLIVSILALHSTEPQRFAVMTKSTTYPTRAACEAAGVEDARKVATLFDREFAKRNPNAAFHSVRIECDAGQSI